jgi:hypothetical protein
VARTLRAVTLERVEFVHEAYVLKELGFEKGTTKVNEAVVETVISKIIERRVL